MAVSYALRHRFGAVCHLVETNALASDGGLTWSTCAEGNVPVLRDRDGEWFDVRELDLIWWRRASYPQRDLPEGLDVDTREFVSLEGRYALVGMLVASFTGKWVNHPASVRSSENKLIQLWVAEREGLRVPRTVISQNPEVVRRFVTDLEGRVIVKAVRGLAGGQPLLTVPFDPSGVDDASIRISPAIYQERVAGTRHLRICCFGDRMIAAALDSPDLDWRRNLRNVPFVPWEIDEVVKHKLKAVLDLLGIRMAVMDAKVTPHGEMVWLEANPQGQFLFIEGLTGLDLTTAFCEFLLAEAADRRSERSGKGEAEGEAQPRLPTTATWV
jgi:hypothetical protein